MQTSLVEITITRYINAMQKRSKLYIGSSLRCVGIDMWILTDTYAGGNTDSRLNTIAELMYEMATVIGEIQE